LSDYDPDSEIPYGVHAQEGRTKEHSTIAGTLTAPHEGPEQNSADEAVSEDEEWVSKTTHGIRLGIPLAALLTVVLVAAGFWGGAELEKSRASSSSPAAALAARFRSGAGSGAAGTAGLRFGGALGGSTAAATGTVSVVAGNTLYVLTSTGSLVTVTLTKSTTITRNATATAVDLRPGDTITVQGATSGGSVTATSISATAPGVSSSAGGSGARGAGVPGATSATTTNPGG
jgi:Domain of unknown function (DUF5666)